MKKTNKALLLALCAVLLVGATVAGTYAYLISQQTVKNTFAVGRIGITMDEAQVNEYGVPQENHRNTGNKYLLVPGYTYTKDPIVYVDAASESCYVFVEITNGIASYIDVTALEGQLLNNGWQKLNDKAGVWYQAFSKGQGDCNLEVFESFTVLANADSVEGWSEINPEANAITVTAYAIQKDSFIDEKAAWSALMVQLGNP